MSPLESQGGEAGIITAILDNCGDVALGTASGRDKRQNVVRDELGPAYVWPSRVPLSGTPFGSLSQKPILRSTSLKQSRGLKNCPSD